MADPIVFRLADPEREPAVSLIARAEVVLVELYGSSSTIAPDRLAAPDGGYVVGWRDDIAVAGGGFVRHDDHSAEIRRMFVMPEARSQGIARQLLAAIEDMMRRAGYRRAILDTGPDQPHAEALYRSAGYIDVENYLDPASSMSFWGAKQL